MRHAASIIAGFLRFASVLALVMIGFAHQPVAAYPNEARIPAYELPDGSYASLCIGDHDSKPHTTKDFGCDACRLTSAILVPQAPMVGQIALAAGERTRLLERAYRLSCSLYPPSSGPRAPPAISMFV